MELLHFPSHHRDDAHNGDRRVCGAGSAREGNVALDKHHFYSQREAELADTSRRSVELCWENFHSECQSDVKSFRRSEA